MINDGSHTHTEHSYFLYKRHHITAQSQDNGEQHRTWFNWLFCGLFYIHGFGLRQPSHIPGVLDYVRWHYMHYTSCSRCTTVFVLVHKQPYHAEITSHLSPLPTMPGPRAGQPECSHWANRLEFGGQTCFGVVQMAYCKCALSCFFQTKQPSCCL